MDLTVDIRGIIDDTLDMKIESKKSKVARISHSLAVSWLELSERVLGRNEENWNPSKLSAMSERAMMATTSEYSMLLPWGQIRENAVAIAKEILFLRPEEYPLTISYFSPKIPA